MCPSNLPSVWLHHRFYFSFLSALCVHGADRTATREELSKSTFEVAERWWRQPCRQAEGPRTLTPTLCPLGISPRLLPCASLGFLSEPSACLPVSESLTCVLRTNMRVYSAPSSEAASSALSCLPLCYHPLFLLEEPPLRACFWGSPLSLHHLAPSSCPSRGKRREVNSLRDSGAWTTACFSPAAPMGLVLRSPLGHPSSFTPTQSVLMSVPTTVTVGAL